MIVLAPRYEQNDDIHGFAMHGRDILDNARVIECIKEKVIGQLDQIGKEYGLVAGTTAKAPNYMKLHRVPVEPRTAAPRLARQKHALLVLGREDSGMTDAEMRVCDTMITIPTSAEYPTMNVSHAAAIVLYETWLARGPLCQDTKDPSAVSETRGFETAPRTSRQRFYDWLTATTKHRFEGMTEPWRMENFLLCVKSVIERATITSRELDVIEGFLKTLDQKTPEKT